MVEKNDILLALYGATSGEIAICKINGAINQAILCIRSKNDNVFIRNCWEKHKRTILSTYLQGGQGNLSAEIVKDIQFSFPQIKEQKKISSLLSLIDERISTQKKIIEDLKKFKGAIAERLFTPAKDWKQCKLSDFTNRVTKKNVENETEHILTISAKYGLVDQFDFFNKQIASQDISGYYLLNKGDFAYNKSYSNGYPWGAVKRLDRYEKGVVSTLYICFSPKSEIVSSNYLAHYFETTKWHQGVADISGEGARNHGLLNMSINDYFSTIHFIPSTEQQSKITDTLNAICYKISNEEQILIQYKSQKSFLLSQMFI